MKRKVAFFGLIVLFLIPIQARPAALVTDGVVNAIQEYGEAMVLIKLRDPASLSERPMMRGQQIAEVQSRVLEMVSDSEFEVIHLYRISCGMSGRLRAGGLDILKDLPEVEQIYLDRKGHAHLNQSVPLIGADVVHDMNLSGDGIVVAILDTGVDTDHTNLSDGDIIKQNCFLDANQNQDCNGSSAEDDNGHGTNVASIITSNGNLGGVGVAPDADIVALKCLCSGGVFWTSDVVDALDWLNYDYCDTAQVDIINMSIGTYDLYSSASSAEADFPNLTDQLDYARDTNGIIPFASAGNDGSSTEIAVPAALSSVVAVGAVYDSNIGSYSWSGVCTDNSTAADQVACWSNSCSLVDLLAPGCKISTSWMGGGTGWYCGTSQASPHAAGAAALMLENKSTLTPDQIETALEDYGKDITDTKNSLTRPRIDILRTLDRVWISDASWDDGTIPCKPESWHSPDIQLNPCPPVISQPCTISVTWHNFTSITQTTGVSVEVHDPSVNLVAGQPCLWGVSWYDDVDPESSQTLDFEWTPNPNSFGEGHYCVIAFIETMDNMDVVHHGFPPKDNNVTCHNFHLTKASFDTLTFNAGNIMDYTGELYLHVDRSQLSDGCLAGINYPEDIPIPLDPGEWLYPEPQIWVYVPDSLSPTGLDDTLHVTSTLISMVIPDTIIGGISWRIMPTPEVWSDDFNDCDISDWTVVTTGTGLIETTTEQYVSPPCGLKMDSQGDSRAYASSPLLDLDTSNEYTISFWFKIPNSDNHWFMVMDNGQVHLVVDQDTDLTTWDGSTSQYVESLSVDTWYYIQCVAHPSSENYEVHVNGDSLVTAEFLYTEGNDCITVGDRGAGSTDHGEGFWDDISVVACDVTTTDVKRQGGTPTSFTLYQNYPNPFNPTTVIRYHLTHGCMVTLEVYNVRGQKVATLINREYRDRGPGKVRWDAGSLASGVYLLRFDAGGIIKSRKIVLLK
jgi:subtilisin family serine protease